MEWQPIETAPKDGTEIVLLDMLPPAIAQVAFWQGGQWCGRYVNDEFDFDSATHWQPLPQPPGEKT